MSLDPIISAQVHRPCQKFTFHDAKAFFNLPTIVVYLYYGGDIIFKICTNSIESIINSFLLYQILIDAIDVVLGYFPICCAGLRANKTTIIVCILLFHFIRIA